MRVFLTGGTGYIGSAVAERLLRDGHAVTGLARSDVSAERLTAAGVTPLRGDLGDTNDLRRAVEAAEGVVHVGFSHDDWSRMDAAFARDQVAVEAMLGALAGTGKPFVYTSGSGVLADTGATLADESAPTNEDGPTARRVATERLVLAAARKDVRGIVLRPGLVYGRGGSGVVGLMIGLPRRAGVGRTIGDGGNAWSAIHLDDTADAYALALTGAGPGTLLHLAAGEPVEMRKIAAAIGKGLGQSGAVEVWPLAEARLQLGVLADGLAADKRISAARAERLLGWRPSRPSLLDELVGGSYAPVFAAHVSALP